MIRIDYPIKDDIAIPARGREGLFYVGRQLAMEKARTRTMAPSGTPGAAI